LKNTKIIIVEADDGFAAYQKAKEIVPDLVIADIRMPKYDGFQLLEKLKSDKKLKHIPVIAYSASVLKAQKERIHKSEFSGLLIKPVSITELYLTLMNILPYTLLRKDEDDTKDPDVIISGDIIQPDELIHCLETTFNERWKTFAVTQPLNEIHEFATDLYNLGSEHNSHIVVSYGQELIDAADTFNIDTLLKLILKYKSIIENLKNSTKK
jgi:CheY-like chemotaxis protein